MKLRPAPNLNQSKKISTSRTARRASRLGLDLSFRSGCLPLLLSLLAATGFRNRDFTFLLSTFCNYYQYWEPDRALHLGLILKSLGVFFCFGLLGNLIKKTKGREEEREEDN